MIKRNGGDRFYESLVLTFPMEELMLSIYPPSLNNKISSALDRLTPVTLGNSGRTKQIAIVPLIFLAFLLFSAFVPTTMLQSAVAQKVQPQLLAMVVDNPTETVSIIVQKSRRDHTVEESVGQLGGVVTNDLSVLNAFAAKVPGRVVLQLAASSAVRWISLDKPVEGSQKNGTPLQQPQLIAI